MNKLKEYREKYKVTQEDLARETNLTLRTIARIEKDDNCNLESAKKICKYFKCKLEDIFK